MSLPPLPKQLPKQRHAGRFWNTDDVMELLSIYHGTRTAEYQKTWQYRTLITLHRELNSAAGHRKGYGPDWKYEIKGTLLEYVRQGKIPFQALAFAATHIRELELKAWADTRIQRLQKKRECLAAAA